MEFGLISIIVFVILVVINGSTNAFIAEGIKFFDPGVLMFYRYFFAFVLSIIIFIFRYIIDHNGLRNALSSLFSHERKKLYFLLLGGIFSVGMPSSLISTGQKWVSSASAQLMNPIASASGALFSHFFLSDEKFSNFKLYSLLSAITGVGFTSIPLFNHASNNTSTGSNSMLIGFLLVFFGTVMIGLYPGLLKLKVPDMDISLSIVFQLLSAVIYYIIWSLIFYDWETTKKTIKLPINYWISPLVLGIIKSGLCLHGYMYLVGKIGSFGVNLLPFGQIIVGVSIGVLFLKEWKDYSFLEYTISILGMLVLFLSLWFGLNDKKPQTKEQIQKKQEESSTIEEL